jgi:cell division transport system permease protein
MKTWLRHQRDAIARAVTRLAQAPLASLVSVLVIGVTLALPVGLYILLSGLKGVASRINAEPQISVYLVIDASLADVQAMDSKLKANPAIAQYKFISKDDALAEMRTLTGLGEVVDGLDRNPLPHAFVIRAKSNDPAALERLRAELATLPRAEHVQLDSAWARRLASFNAAGEKIVLMLTVALGIALLAVTGNTIRLQILTQRDEIEVGRLIGATDGYVRRPYLYFGALQGLAGGVLALALAVGGLVWLSAGVGELIRLYAPDFRADAIRWQLAASVVGLAVSLGWLGSYVSVALYLRQIKPR